MLSEKQGNSVVHHARPVWEEGQEPRGGGRAGLSHGGLTGKVHVCEGRGRLVRKSSSLLTSADATGIKGSVRKMDYRETSCCG